MRLPKLPPAEKSWAVQEGYYPPGCVKPVVAMFFFWLLVVIVGLIVVIAR